jgi:hypothetical protein
MPESLFRKMLMRSPARPKTPNRLITKSIPPPIEGWDSSSPIQAMLPKRALYLDNWFPEQAYCRIRRGHVLHAQVHDEGEEEIEEPPTPAVPPAPITSAVETLMAYHGLTANKLFAVAGGTINDVTANDDGVFVDDGYTNSRFQHTNFTTSGGKFLVGVNGADTPITYDGSTLGAVSVDSDAVDDAIHINAHKRRLWFTINESTVARYLPIDSIGGTSVAFDFGAQFTKGGYLMATGTWTIDSGSGPDDLFVAISSRGQVAIYQGTNPASADTWSLVGVFDLGAPIGRRCLTKIAGDLALITIDGVIPLSKAISLDRGAIQLVELTARIQKAMNDAATLYGANFGWQLIGYPRGTAAFLNIPTTEGSAGRQFVMNTLSGAWCRYIGMNAICWETMDDRIFFGGAGGKVFEHDIGSLDNGMAITLKLKPAFNYFGSPGKNKHFKQVRPILTTNGQVVPSIDLNVDFEDRDPPIVATVIELEGALWGEAVWGSFEWGSTAEQSQAEWIEASNVGFCATPNMRAQVSQSSGLDVVLHVNGFDVRYEEAEQV